MEKRQTYPIGQQDFKILREMGNAYVDKTRYIAKILEDGNQYYFLARPRRFGKSLFLSTMKCFFEGERDLFKGLYIDSTGWSWERYPVFHLDLNTERYASTGKLEEVLDNILVRWEKQYGVEKREGVDFSRRFENVIRTAHEVTGLRVVILVDEYDKPLVANLNNSRMFDTYRRQLASLYSNFKSSAAHIRMVFMTGVSRFSRLSVFSDLNNLQDITFSESFADICGITEKEMIKNFEPGINLLAETYGYSYEKTCGTLKKNYDGYRFAANGSYMYNPWSLLNCLQQRSIENYWNETGMPTLIAESLKRLNVNLEKFFDDTYCTADDLKGLDLLNPSPVALLYQTGYLTIKDYRPKLRRFKLGIPNMEVKTGLFKVLLPYYVTTRSALPAQVVSDIPFYFDEGRPEDAMKCIQIYFAGVDYKLQMDNENNFHNAFFLLMDLMGLETEAEAHTSDGSIDIVIKTDAYIYIIELKYDHSAESALRQIEEKRYALQYEADRRRIYEIGVSFSSKTRTIEDWIIRPHLLGDEA